MDSFSVNQTQTSVNPVRSGSREVIQCLIDWLNKEPSDEKPHRLLRALANESIKKASFEENKRRFSGRSDLAEWDFHPLEKRRLITAHTQSRHTDMDLSSPIPVIGKVALSTHSGHSDVHILKQNLRRHNWIM